MRLHRNNYLLTVIVLVLSLGLISCKDADKRQDYSIDSLTQDESTPSKPFFTNEQEKGSGEESR